MSACTAKKKSGEPCSAKRMEGSEFCSFHDPAKAQAFNLGRQVGAREGGKVTSHRATRNAAIREEVHQLARGLGPSVAPDEPPLPLDGAQDIIDAARDTLNRVRSRKLTPKEGTAISALLSVALQGMKRLDETRHENEERPMSELPPGRFEELRRTIGNELEAAEH